MIKNIKNSTYKKVSKIISVFMRIGNVCSWIGVACMILGAGALAVTSRNIDINSETQELTAFGIHTNYKIEAQSIKFENGFEFKLTDEAANNIKNYISNDLERDLLFGSITMTLAAVTLSFVAMCLHNSANLFKSIAEEKTPFTEENIDYVDKIFIYLVIILFSSWIVSMMVEIFFKNSVEIHYGGGTLTTLAITFMGSYFLKRGYELESKNKK